MSARTRTSSPTVRLIANLPPSTSGSTPSITTRRVARTDCPITVVATVKVPPSRETKSSREFVKPAAGTQDSFASSIIYRIEAQETSTKKLLLPQAMFLYLRQQPGEQTTPSTESFPSPALQQRFEALFFELLFRLGRRIRIAVGTHGHSIEFVVAVPEHHRRKLLFPQILRQR